MFKLININYPETAKNSKYINNDTLTVLDDKSCLKFASGINHDDIKASYGRSHYVFVGDLLPSSRPKYRKFDLYARMYVVCNEKQDRIFITDKVPGYPGYGLMLFYHNTLPFFFLSFVINILAIFLFIKIAYTKANINPKICIYKLFK